MIAAAIVGLGWWSRPLVSNLQGKSDGIGFVRAMDCPTPLFSTTEPMYQAAMEQGREAQDTASICAVLEDTAGLTERK